jgi:hypothetical protein
VKNQAKQISIETSKKFAAKLMWRSDFGVDQMVQTG